MKIVYCIAGIFNSGGMERVLSNKANYLAAKGFDIVIITTDQRTRPTFFNFDPRITHLDLGINYDSNNNKSLLKKISSYSKKQSLHKKKLSEVLMQIKADIVISMFDHEVPFLYKINDGSKKILEIHFSRYKRIQYARKGLWGLIDRFRSKQDQWRAKKYDKFVVLTHEDKSLWGEMGNIMVIPNANSFESKEVSTLLEKGAIAVGRFDYQKGFDDLIKAWSYVAEVHPDWTLNIFGHGPLQGDYIQLIHYYQLQDKIKILQPVKDIKNEYLVNSMVLMTSRYEGFGMVLIEAQVCGLPLLAYACKCGPSDIITENVNGNLFKVGDVRGLAKGIIRLIENVQLRKELGNNSKTMSANYSEEKIMSIWITLFNTMTRTV